MAASFTLIKICYMADLFFNLSGYISLFPRKESRAEK